MNLKPLGDRVILKQDEAEVTTASGLFLASDAKEKPQTGTIIAVGEGKMDKMAKQTAGQRNFQVALTDQFRYDLAPDFFLIGMLKSSSARVIINSRASVSSLEKDRAFSSSLMRFFNWAFSSL